MIPLLIIKISVWIIIASTITIPARADDNRDKRGLFPDLMNLASTSSISANATCGQYGQEHYCKLTEHSSPREPQCEVCDARSPDPSRRHPPENAIDGTSSWWQSPSLAQGAEYEFITITLDLQQVYQVAYVILKSAISPRPGNWILERSLDDFNYQPWQYYAVTDNECMKVFGVPPTTGRPAYAADDDVICTSYFSKVIPLEGGEIHTSLVNGRPGSSDPSPALLKFTEARFIRFRFQKIKTLQGELQGRTHDIDPSVSNRYFYSIKDISIGGRCVCNGHADTCEIIQGQPKCSCSHNACGPTCEQCCPMFNQYEFKKGNSSDGAPCERCQCYKHASSCRYDPLVEKDKLSLNIHGRYEGGGVCLNCQHFTAGINCQKCKRGYYRPQGMSPDNERPCLPCLCTGTGTSGECIGDDTQVNLGRLPGTCLCKEGFGGSRCNKCADGYLNFPVCEPCPCSRAGSINRACEGECNCKQNVIGPRCDTCKAGTFHLDEYYYLGCTTCFCNHVVNECEAARLAVYTVSEREHWKVTDLRQRRVIAAAQMQSSVSVAREDMSKFAAYFWLAPEDYLGEKMTSYGQTLTIKSSWTNLRGDTSGKPTRSPDVIIEGGRFRIAYGGQYYPEVRSVLFEIPLYEQGWYHFPKDLADIPIDMPLADYQLREVSREEMMEVLSNMKALMIRARFHTEQVESVLHDVVLEYGKEGASLEKAVLVTGAVERCFCPSGYRGLSCEACEPGYRRVNNLIIGGKCVACQCNGHVTTCDPVTGACGECLHNTAGDNCERCAPGYYGDPSKGTEDDCKPCSCPLPVGKNEFIPSCVTDLQTGGFKCLCPRGYAGPRCQQCADGYFGNPMIPGYPCTPCECGGNIDPRARGNCDQLTGECLKCLGNTAGFHCERCIENHFGDPQRGQCNRCGCHEVGSQSMSCDPQTGQCPCKNLYAGMQCDRCVAGRGGIMEGCPLCMCDRRGSVSEVCDSVTGLCPCRPGVGGRHCDACLENHFGDIAVGCSLGGVSFVNFGVGNCAVINANAADEKFDSGSDLWTLVEGSGIDDDEKGSVVEEGRSLLESEIELLNNQNRGAAAVNLKEFLTVDNDVSNAGYSNGDVSKGSYTNRDVIKDDYTNGDVSKVSRTNDEVSKVGFTNSDVDVFATKDKENDIPTDEKVVVKKVNVFENSRDDTQQRSDSWSSEDDEYEASELNPALSDEDYSEETKIESIDDESGIDEDKNESKYETIKNVENYSNEDYDARVASLVNHAKKNDSITELKSLLESIETGDGNQTRWLRNSMVSGVRQRQEEFDSLNRSAKPFNDLTSMFNGKLYRHNHIRGVQRPDNYTVYGRLKHTVVEDRENVSTKTSIYPNKVFTTENRTTSRVSTNSYGKFQPLLARTRVGYGQTWVGIGEGYKDTSALTNDFRKLRIGHKYPDTFKRWRGLKHGCDCDDRGSVSKACDIVTGQCGCRSFVVGRTCNSCKVGYWGLANGDCRKCDCEVKGSTEGQCDDQTGQCQCRPGVGGPRCDHCLPGYWGFSPRGCKPCEPCGFPGRNCDPNSGRCVCPPNTEGDKCERCSQGFWDYSADIGCRSCRCSGPGSLERQCDPRNGQCVCREGYEGGLCNQCSFGYFGYPHCRPCLCNKLGTDPRRCRDEFSCQCDENGQCPCKANSVGRDCGKCAEGTFGLSAENSLGCFQCFCFKKSSRCEQADLTWSQLALPSERRLGLGKGETQLNVTNQLYVIPHTDGDVKIGTALPFLAPIYWQLPRSFMRDKIRSYNGFLKFRVQIDGNRKSFPDQILHSYPLVSMQGNWQLVLEYYPPIISPDGRYAVRLHEDLWRIKHNPRKVTREEMMIALQNIQHILIRATHSDDFASAVLSEVTLDVAAEGTPVSSRKALGVEFCHCPQSYSGLSCQNPNVGFYRWYKENHIQSQIIIDLVGESKPCDCNGRANVCDQETGICVGCEENTAGPHCEVCATGYYGNPNRGRCKPCACPSRQQNFAETCQADPYSEYICHCREGYTGHKCERCADGYYGNPSELGGSCRSCLCDPNGSIGKSCDNSGNCRCKPGITGRDCSQCAPRHVVSENGCISCEDGCVNILLDDVEAMINEVTSVDIDGFIPAPWPSLNTIRNYTGILASQLDKYESRVDVSQNMLLHFGLDNKARILHRRAEKMEGNAKDNLIPSKELHDSALSVKYLLKTLRVTLEAAVAYLDHYGILETPQISTSAAVDEAERLLREIKSRSFREFEGKAEVELQRSKLLLERVRKMQQNGEVVTILSNRFHEMKDNIEDLQKRIRESKRNISLTKSLDENLRKKIVRIKNHLEEIVGLNMYTEDRNFNTSRMVRKARRNLNNVHKNFNIIIELMVEMKDKSAALSEFEAALWHLNSEFKDKYVDRAEDHALHLKAQAIKLEKLFTKTRDVADGPLRAAEAYQRIVDALKSAKEAAQNASNAAGKAYNVAYPGNAEDSLVRISKHSLDNSRGLEIKGNGLRNRVQTITTSLTKHKRDLESTADLVRDSNQKLEIISQKFETQFPQDLSPKIQVALNSAEETDESIGRTLEHVESMHTNLTIIKQYTSQISSLDSSLFQEIRAKIVEVEGGVEKGRRQSNNLIRQSNRIEVMGNNLKDRIEQLKRKIKQTRQHASSIRVSLTTDDYGVCTRKYRPFLHPSTTNRFTLGYAINSDSRDALLLFMSSSNVSDFMAVEMKDRRIHFTWDAGGGPETIMHPLKLETNNRLASDDTKWYHITISRVGNVGEMSVRPAFIKNSSRKKLYNEPVRGVSPAGFSRMDIQPWDYTWIGGVPDGFTPKLGTKAFAGCLHYVTIDGEPLGLWNFTQSIGCSACNEGYELHVEQEDKTAFSFNGKGYFKGYNKRGRPLLYYSTVLSFKSLDEDALLFLSYNEEQNQYFSLGLNDGHVKFVVQFNEQTRLVMKSEKKLNNMDSFIQIQATVGATPKNGVRSGRLVVGDQDQFGTIKGGPDLNITFEPFYIGGVDPEFKRDQIGKEIELRSLLGCLGGIHVHEVGKNPLTDGQFYGVQETCPSEPLNDVGFLAQGFLEMPSRVLKRESNFGFTFKTMEADALLMISTFVGQDDDAEELTTTTTTTERPQQGGLPNPPDFYSVSLVEGYLNLQMFAGSQRSKLVSNERFNDGKLHSFFVIKENRKVRLFVDDYIVNSTKLDRGSNVVEAPKEGGLFFGGVPPDINVGSMVGSSVPLKGCIQDVIINDGVLPFNKPIRFDNAFIGRCADLPRHAMGGMESDVKSTVSCQPPKQHTVEFGALKFGDKTESHVIVPIKKNTFKQDFEISFEFRTFYPSGLFFISFSQRINKKNKKKLNLISAKLLNGRLVITIKNNREERKIISPTTGLNSGEWRKVLLEKTKRKLRVIIDDTVVSKEKLSKKSRFGNNLFLGGLPFELANSSGINIQEPFKGCFRNLIVNNEKFEIPSHTRQEQIVGVGQCFASVQPGSYFPGDAYAIYDDNFQVGPLLELRLEFKTWELNGVLLSVANPGKNIALSLELDNGAVILSVNIEHKHPFSAQVSLPNRYSLCDNQWHTVKAHYIKDSLTLKVDSNPEAYGFNGSNNLNKTIAEAPLYVGGIPESSPSGTLLGRENFKGCIRNIVLNSERRDWSDMYKLENVLLNACPVL